MCAKLEPLNKEISASFAIEEPRCCALNQFIADNTANGTLQAIQAEWFGGNEPDVDLPSATGTNGTLTIAVSTNFTL